VTQDADSLLEFPCDFPIKVIGKPGRAIDTVVFSLVRAHAPDLSEGAIRSRASRNGTYQSVTVTIRATDRAQLDRIYRALTAHDDIQMVL
jgi:putative lipoic acid-binding regulatory protein